MKKKFLLIDDHAIVRLAVKMMLQENYANTVIHESWSAPQAMALLEASPYDLVIMDLLMPQTDSTSLVEQILHHYPGTRILVFTMMAESIFATRYFQLGIKGFLNKDCEEKEILAAVDLILSDKKYLSPQLNNALIESTFNTRSENPFEDLSAREREVVRLLLKGKSPQQIKQVLNIEHSTVGTYKIRIFEKMKVTNIVDLLDIARLYRFS
ncbi:MAG TPA: response regulator transcription factor [Chitinophagaceae bacterium]|nr:response regulator transcription factor [Chitinophagaceae bacterium]